MSQTSIDTITHSKKCLDDITSLLVSAGYPKAGDMGHSGEEFDKVVGGLAWVITSTLSTPLPISLSTLLQASSISTRISLSEILHTTLLQMEMPFEISPHQIQGVDAPALLPVVQWAVKNFLERRRLTGDAILNGGGGVEFKKLYGGTGGLYDEEETGRQVEDMQERFRVKGRKYRFKGQDDLSVSGTEEQRVHKCLLEYGEKMRSYRGLKGGDGGGNDGGGGGVGGIKQGKVGKLSAFDRQLADAQKVAEEEEKALDESRERMAAQLMQDCEELGAGAEVAGRGGVGGLVTLGKGEIGDANEEYEKMRAQMLKERQDRDEKKEMYLARKKALERDIAEGGGALEVKSGEREQGEKARAEMARMRGDVQQESAMNSKIVEEMQKLSQKEEESGQKEAMKELWELVQRNERVKREEKAFKEDCKKKMDALRAALENFGANSNESEEERTRTAEIEGIHSKILAKHEKVRQLLAQRNLQVASTSRKIDDVPTRTELIQYERRFVELYQQVALKLEETRRYYATYNTLDTTRNFLAKEVKLIDSITNNFEGAMRNKASQEEFLQQFESIIKGVQDSLSKQEAVMKRKQDEVAEKDAEYTLVIEDQRKYFKLVKDFQEECNRNEALTLKVEEIGGGE
ncbi:hypothetical protein TrCOL_g1666 [Triparma columacea]|uniref:CCDC93 coiled-coil domain-containing protein n=1 Tax=Triparma columacea TaxID=722753 RepID=A0A9W7LD49_9STRA|nr:hypothetical protein TrCOL_g1666 [Triparma columacea]